MIRAWHFTRGLADRMGAAHLGLIAAGVAFYAMLGIFPGLAAVIAIWGLVADPHVIASYLDVAREFIPPEAFAILTAQIDTLLEAPRQGLGWATAVSVAIALYSARAGVAGLVEGIDILHDTRPRHGIAAFILGQVLTLALVGVMLVALAVVVVVPLVLAFLPMAGVQALMLKALPWVAMLALMLTALGILYRYGPNTPDRTERWFSTGAVVACLGWAGASLAFSYYLGNFGAYNRIYGSLGAVIALLMWLYLSVWVVLAGAAVNAQIAARARAPDRDQPPAPPQPRAGITP
ncbi:YihY/virulence factor BrkB family protein [Phaeovulum vinaykumarii]|uniref:Membrane protein n=1 Tax=Phaeovulum vinaykumarii TaxID=407234 RepID=A0A1N7K8P9_9RHOB|nr:YihY/virulence factor BrkB family protein [Phaeovulum vinaykumarii]SIS57966.1 membrane protein [Phaeovulum vinaykumarii]SOB93634.1 membrane protein [Phaeovulum vinaykumarii]